MSTALLTIAGLFARVSLLAVGGINSTLPEISRQVVGVQHWMSPQQFSEIFAIGQSAPGPNLLGVTLIGAHVAGPLGGLVATLAMLLPAGTLVIIVSKLWDRFREKRWRRVVQAALLPITAGLVLAAAGVLVRQADHAALTIAITVISALLIWRTPLHPLWVLSGGAVLWLVLL